MQIEFLNCHRGEHLVQFDTDTPEGRAKLAEEFERLVKCGTGIFLERAGKEGTETLRVTGYDPATDKLLVKIPTEEPVEHVAPCPKVDGDGEVCACPPELKERIADVGDVLTTKATKGRRRGRYRVTQVDKSSGNVVAVAPVSGGSFGFGPHDYDCQCARCTSRRGILAKDWQPQAEGLDAQPKWSGLKQSESEKRFELPEFED